RPCKRKFAEIVMVGFRDQRNARASRLGLAARRRPASLRPRPEVEDPPQGAGQAAEGGRGAIGPLGLLPLRDREGEKVPQAGQADRARARPRRSVRLARDAPRRGGARPGQGRLLLEPAARVSLRALRRRAAGPLRPGDPGPDESRGAAADIPGSRTDLRRPRRAFPAGGAAVLPADARELLRGPGGRGRLAAKGTRMVRPGTALLLAPARGARARLRLRAGRRDASRGPGLEEPAIGLSRRPAPAPPRQRPPDAFAEGVRRGARDRLPGPRPEGEARD